jgi:hypothetical protein
MRSLAVILPFLTLGCAASRVGRPVVWPDPPETARIRFVTAFRGTVDLDNSTWATIPTWRSRWGWPSPTTAAGSTSPITAWGR